MSTPPSPSIVFWTVGVAALVWSGMGALNFAMQLTPGGLAALPEEYGAIVGSRPAWSTAAFGVGAVASVLGAVALLMRRRLAYPLFILSFLAVLVSLLYSAPMQMASPDFSLGDNAMTVLLPILVSALLLWYSSKARDREWLH